MKKNRKWIIASIVIIFSLVIIITTNVAHNANKKEEEIKEIEKKIADTMTITCTNENGNDGVIETEEVYIEKGILITRTNTYEWSKPEPKEKTCEYYTLMVEKLNALPGITGTVYCNEAKTSGNAQIIYTIENVNREDVKLKQFDYLDDNNTFDANAWKYYMENNKYKCIMK